MTPTGDRPQARPDTEHHRRYRDGEAPFLAEASRLLADSLDYETTLGTVAMLALPHLGAWCIVDVVEEGGEIRRVAVVHPDPALQGLAGELRDGWPPSRDDPLGVPAVARTRRSEMISPVDDEMLRRVARNERNLELLQQLGIGSLMIVPLLARGEVLGAITFVAPDDIPRYDAEDLALAEDLAARAAIAIDNARLFRVAEQAREAAERASQAKSQFLGMMSHELRTPINAILGYAQLLDLGIRGGLTDDQRALLQRIESSGRHLLDLVTRLLDASKAETGDLAVQNQVNRVTDVIRGAINAVRPVAGRRRIRSECDPDGEMRFLGDRIRARQILVNLLTNAIRFTGPDGVITITCELANGPVGPDLLRGAGPWLRICVEDHGEGIPPDRINKVFEPFVQGDEATLIRVADGSGLGLAVSRDLARLMGGDLTVVSTPGEGSKFSLWLPAPRSLRETRRDRRLFSREAEGLDLLSDHLLRRLKPIVDTYVARLRQDGAIPGAREASDVTLRDHVPYFLAGLASLLQHADGAGAEVSTVLQGGHAIQRLTLELHGAERQALGWSSDAVRRDLAILREVIEEDLRGHQGGPARADVADVLRRMFQQAERISLQGWHFARSDNQTTRPGPGRGAIATPDGKG